MAVVVVPDKRWGEVVLALFVTTPGSTVTEAEVIAHPRTKLAHCRCATVFEFRASLARTAKLQELGSASCIGAAMERKVQ